MTIAAYSAHENWIAPARNKAEIWRFLIGLVLIAGLYLFLNMTMFQYLLNIAPTLGGEVLGDAHGNGQGSTARAMLIILASFVFIPISVAVVVRMLHQRAPLTILGPMSRVWGQLGASLLFLFVIGALILVLPPYSMGMDLIQPRAFGVWLLLLPLGLLGVLIQTASEEILFRGYIQQQLAARFRSPIIWMVLPSALFALGHYTPAQAGENAMLIAVWSGLFGILMADLTARAGSLGPAIAVHFANNIAALLIVSIPDSLSGLALFILPVSISDTDFIRAWLPVDFATMVVFWLAARLAIRR